jgi:hypothetical protein
MEEKNIITILESLAEVIRECKMEIWRLEYKVKELDEKNKELKEALRNKEMKEAIKNG